MIGIAITAVRHLGDGVRWTAVRLARLESWLVELRRDERGVDCARDVWPGMHDGETNDCCGTRGNVHTGDCETRPARVRAAVDRAPASEMWSFTDMSGVRVYTNRGAAVDRASASLAGYDERPAHCVNCGVEWTMLHSSLCPWCADEVQA